MIDAFSRKVIGWQLASHMCPTWVLNAADGPGQRGPGADFQLVATLIAEANTPPSTCPAVDYTQTLTGQGVLVSSRYRRERL